MARQDTLRSAALSQVRAHANAEAWKDQQKRADAEVERRLRATPDAQILREQLGLIEEALGGPIDFVTNRTFRSPRTPIGIDEIAAIGKMCREYRSLDIAAKELTDGYTVSNVKRAVEQLERAIAGLRAAPGDQLELRVQ